MTIEVPRCGTSFRPDWARKPVRGARVTYIDAAPSGTLFKPFCRLHSNSQKGQAGAFSTADYQVQFPRGPKQAFIFSNTAALRWPYPSIAQMAIPALHSFAGWNQGPDFPWKPWWPFWWDNEEGRFHFEGRKGAIERRGGLQHHFRLPLINNHTAALRLCILQSLFCTSYWFWYGGVEEWDIEI